MICTHYGLQTCKKPWLYVPQPVVESRDVKILWDFEVRTDHVISAQRPDIIVLDYKKKCGILIDVAIPADINIIEKEKEKILKYQDLRIELQKLWNIKLKVIPVVIGSLDAYTGNLMSYLTEIPGSHRLEELLKSALLGSARILQMVLDVQELG